MNRIIKIVFTPPNPFIFIFGFMVVVFYPLNIMLLQMVGFFAEGEQDYASICSILSALAGLGVGYWLLPSGLIAPEFSWRKTGRVRSDLINVNTCVDKKDVESHMICLSKRMENFLVEHFGAQGKGLHEYITSVETKIDDNVLKKLRKLASVRNAAVHDASFDATNLNRIEMQRLAEDAQLALLRSLGLDPLANNLFSHWKLTHYILYLIGGLSLAYLLVLLAIVWVTLWIISFFAGGASDRKRRR